MIKRKVAADQKTQGAAVDVRFTLHGHLAEKLEEYVEKVYKNVKGSKLLVIRLAVMEFLEKHQEKGG